MAWYMTAAMVGMSVMQTRSQNQAIQEQNNALRQQQDVANAMTMANYNLKQQESQDINAVAGMKLSDEARKRLAERGKILAASAESGVAGVSPLRVLANSYMQGSFDKGSIISESEAKQMSLAYQNQATYMQNVSAINQYQSQMSKGISTEQGLLSAGMAGAQGYMMGKSIFKAPAIEPTVGAVSYQAPSSVGNTWMSNAVHPSAQIGQDISYQLANDTYNPLMIPTSTY